MEVSFYETTAFTEDVSKLKAEDQCLELKDLSTIIEAKIQEAKDHE